MISLEKTMAQLVVRDLEESVKRRLKQRATKNGRSLEGEVREILRDAAGSQKSAKNAKNAVPQKGLGTQLMELFAGKVPPDFEIPNFRDEPVRAVDFDE
jgi:plasmid stability protein